MDDDSEPTTVIDAPEPQQPGLPEPADGAGAATASTGRRGPGWTVTIVLTVLLLAAVAGAAYAWNQRADARDELRDVRGELAAQSDEAESTSASADDLADANEELERDNTKLERRVATLERQLKAARVDLKEAREAAADAEAGAGGLSSTDESSLVQATRSQVATLLGNSTGANCATYTVVGASDDASHAIVRADWNASSCANKYETLELLFARASSGAWTHVPVVAHPVNEPDLDTGAICNQVIDASDSIRSEISQACH